MLHEGGDLHQDISLTPPLPPSLIKKVNVKHRKFRNTRLRLIPSCTTLRKHWVRQEKRGAGMNVKEAYTKLSLIKKIEY